MRRPTPRPSRNISTCRSSASRSFRATPIGSPPALAPAARGRFRSARSWFRALRKRLAASLKELAADKLEAAVADLEITRRRGAHRRNRPRHLLRRDRRPAGGTADELTATQSFAPPNATYPNGTHACEVEIDPATGETMIVRYTVVDDFGFTLNPLLAGGAGPWRHRPGRRSGADGAARCSTARASC